MVEPPVRLRPEAERVRRIYYPSEEGANCLGMKKDGMLVKRDTSKLSRENVGNNIFEDDGEHRQHLHGAGNLIRIR